jgi:hypothetical protein
MSLCHEQSTEAVKRGAVGVDGTFIPRTEAATGQAWPTVGREPGLFGGYFVDPANRGRLAFLAERVSFTLHLLAAVAAVGRARGLVAGLADLAGSVG